MNRFLGLIIFLCLQVSCSTNESNKIDISAIEGTVKIDRFDLKFYNTAPEELSDLKKEYPYLFPLQNHDSIWLQRMASEDELHLFESANTVFGNFEKDILTMDSLFKHVKYYNSDFKFPKIITLISDLDYESKVIYADSLLFISLDLYMGKNNEVYGDFPKYLSRNFERRQLPVDVANAISDRYVLKSRDRQFINALIEEGKKVAMIDHFLPVVPSHRKMGYTKAEEDWLLANEVEVWKYFIENELLFSTDSDLHARFIANAPFSKFYIDIDKNSPGRVGVWLGWQIVKSFMENNDVDLQQTIKTSSEELFKNSKYKPKK